MKNNTKIKVANKYLNQLEEIDYDGGEYWAYSKRGFYFEEMGLATHTAHEDTQHELLKVIRSLKPCNCSECEEINQ